MPKPRHVQIETLADPFHVSPPHGKERNFHILTNINKVFYTSNRIMVRLLHVLFRETFIKHTDYHLSSPLRDACICANGEF